jgi:type IV pilus assembly protein PilB
MAISRKPGPSVQSPAASADLLQILMFRKVLTREQAERVRRYARANSVGVVPAMVEMKLASEVQVGEALAAFAGLRFVKINPLELDLDVVTGALSAAFARRHGLVAIAKTSTTLTVAVHDPLVPFPADDIKNVSGLEIERVVATRTDVDAVTKNFYDLRTSLRRPTRWTRQRRRSSRRSTIC